MTPHDKQEAWAEIASDLIIELYDDDENQLMREAIFRAFEKVEDEVFRRIVATLQVERK